MSGLYKMGEMPIQWREGKVKTITFCVTEDCNLICKYCYLVGKNSRNKMTFEVAKKAVDYILANREIFNDESVVWEFIGGEPFLEIDLIDQICDYIKYQMYTLNHHWFGNYKFSFSTNGILYDTPKVQKYIAKNRGNISVGMSVDGNKMKHDLQRVYPDGSGSYEDVLRNVPLWMDQFPNAGTKATFSRGDIQYLKDSIISLWNIGIKSVAANVVFEDVWEEGDDILFEKQLKELADYILENGLWKDYSVRFFSENTGLPLGEEESNKNFCGAGKMMAIDYQGKFFPCVRFVDYSLSNREGLCIGDINTGINLDKLRPFIGLTLKSQSKQECIDCEVASGCAWCTGHNYDYADTDTVYQRLTYLCKMHKANCRANDYFWDRFEKVTGIISERSLRKKDYQRLKELKSCEKKLLFITSDQITPHCIYRNDNNTRNIMSESTYKKGIEFAKNNNFLPIILGDTNYKCETKDYFRISSSNSKTLDEYSLVVYDNTDENINSNTSNCILILNANNLHKMCSLIKSLSVDNYRINLVLEDIQNWSSNEIKLYESQLDELVDYAADEMKYDRPYEISVLTDILYSKEMCNCGAGQDTFALAPNGKIYVCPAFYFDDPNNSIGSLEEGITIKNQYLMELESATICGICDAFHCKRCKFLNKKLTNEFNVPSKIQCAVSHIERKASLKLQDKLFKLGVKPINKLYPVDYDDPMELLNTKNKGCL